MPSALGTQATDVWPIGPLSFQVAFCSGSCQAHIEVERTVQLTSPASVMPNSSRFFHLPPLSPPVKSLKALPRHPGCLVFWNGMACGNLGQQAVSRGCSVCLRPTAPQKRAGWCLTAFLGFQCAGVGGPLGLSILACCIRRAHALSGGRWDVMTVASVWQGAHMPGTGLAVPVFSSRHAREVSGKASESWCHPPPPIKQNHNPSSAPGVCAMGAGGEALGARHVAVRASWTLWLGPEWTQGRPAEGPRSDALLGIARGDW